MNVLVDTSVWISHLRSPVSGLIELLEERRALTHESVIGELSCGTFHRRHEILGNLKILPRVPSPRFNETLEFLETHRLFGKGLSWTDLQLLASSALAGTKLLTLDKALNRAAQTLHLKHP